MLLYSIVCSISIFLASQFFCLRTMCPHVLHLTQGLYLFVCVLRPIDSDVI